MYYSTCCGVSEACMFSSPSSIISFCMDQCLSISISVRFDLSFWYVIVPVCGQTILLLGLKGHIFKILGNKYAFECMQTHSDKLARIKD